MQQSIIKLGSLSMLAVLTVLVGMSYFGNSSDTELLFTRLSLLESKIKQPKPARSSGTSNKANSEQLAILQEQIETLQNKLTQVASNMDYYSKSQIESENKITNTLEEEPVGDKTANLQLESELANTIKNTGYLYKEDWKNLEQTLASMDKDENKQFWQSITSAIENNEIELYSD